MTATMTPTMAMVVYWRLRYAAAPSCTAPEISCMRCVPALLASTERLA